MNDALERSAKKQGISLFVSLRSQKGSLTESNGAPWLHLPIFEVVDVGHAPATRGRTASLSPALTDSQSSFMSNAALLLHHRAEE